jgi:ABC-type spermidine/putrescine transport system permease subunit I
MNLAPQTMKIIGFILIGISCALLGFIIAYNWRNENELPEWVNLFPIFLPLMATFLIRKAKKRDAGGNLK